MNGSNNRAKPNYYQRGSRGGQSTDLSSRPVPSRPIPNHARLIRAWGRATARRIPSHRRDVRPAPLSRGVRCAMLAKNPQGSVETRRAGKRASALDTATVIDAPRPDWAPLWRAPFYCYSESYIPSAEIWVEALCGTVNNIASSWSGQFDKHELPKLNQVELREWSIQQSKDPEIVVTARGLRTYIKPGWIAVYPEYAEGFDVDFDVDDWLIAGWSSGILKDPDWDNLSPVQQLAAAWHRRLLTGLFQYWKSELRQCARKWCRPHHGPQEQNLSAI